MNVERFGISARLVAENSELVGLYVVPGSGPLTKVPTSTPCPYCREPLHALSGEQAYRVLKVLELRADGGAIAEVEAIPPTHRALSCKQCKSVFTEPR